MSWLNLSFFSDLSGAHGFLDLLTLRSTGNQEYVHTRIGLWIGLGTSWLKETLTIWINQNYVNNNDNNNNDNL